MSMGSRDRWCGIDTASEQANQKYSTIPNLAFRLGVHTSNQSLTLGSYRLLPVTFAAGDVHPTAHLILGTNADEGTDFIG
jgi:hypothetical protein